MRLGDVAHMHTGAVFDEKVGDGAADAGGTGRDEHAQALLQGDAGHGNFLGWLIAALPQRRVRHFSTANRLSVQPSGREVTGMLPGRSKLVRNVKGLVTKIGHSADVGPHCRQ